MGRMSGRSSNMESVNDRVKAVVHSFSDRRTLAHESLNFSALLGSFLFRLPLRHHFLRHLLHPLFLLLVRLLPRLEV